MTAPPATTQSTATAAPTAVRYRSAPAHPADSPRCTRSANRNRAIPKLSSSAPPSRPRAFDHVPRGNSPALTMGGYLGISRRAQNNAGNYYDLEGRLLNWGRWLRIYRKRGQAFSLEGAFSEHSDEWDWYEDGPRQSKRPSPSMSDAWDIEIACRILPVRQHFLLKLRYLGRVQNDVTVHHEYRKATGERLTARRLIELEASSKVNLAAALEVPQVVRMERALRAVQKLLQKALDNDGAGT